MKIRCIITAVVLISMALPVQAKTSPPLPLVAGPSRLPMVREGSPFAFPGTECPVGSKPYSGPGSSQAKNAGAIYCVFIPQAMVFSKDATGGKCPGNTHPYETVGETPPDDMLWCSFMVPPEMPPMPVAPNLPIGKPMAGPLATGAARDKKPAQ